MERGSGRFENITHAADRVDQFGLKRIVHLCPQATHDHVDYVRIGFESYVPHVFCNFVARYNFDPTECARCASRRNSLGVRFSGIPPRSAR